MARDARAVGTSADSITRPPFESDHSSRGNVGRSRAAASDAHRSCDRRSGSSRSAHCSGAACAAGTRSARRGLKVRASAWESRWARGRRHLVGLSGTRNRIHFETESGEASDPAGESVAQQYRDLKHSRGPRRPVSRSRHHRGRFYVAAKESEGWSSRRRVASRIVARSRTHISSCEDLFAPVGACEGQSS